MDIKNPLGLARLLPWLADMGFKEFIFVTVAISVFGFSAAVFALECKPETLQKYQNVQTCSSEDNHIPKTLEIGSILRYYQQSYSFECIDACNKPLNLIVVLERNCEGDPERVLPPQIYDPGYNEEPPSTRANDQLSACPQEKVRLFGPERTSSKEYELFNLRYHKAFDPITNRAHELESQ